MRKDVMIRRAECRVFGNWVEVEAKAVLPSNNEIFFHFSALYIIILEECQAELLGMNHVHWSIYRERQPI